MNTPNSQNKSKCCDKCSKSKWALKGKFKDEFGGCGLACECHNKCKEEGCDREKNHTGFHYAQPQATVNEEVHHYSDCAIHNEPAFPKGECNCGGFIPSDDEQVSKCCEKCDGIIRDENSFGRDYGCLKDDCSCHAQPQTPAKEEQASEKREECKLCGYFKAAHPDENPISILSHHFIPQSTEVTEEKEDWVKVAGGGYININAPQWRKSNSVPTQPTVGDWEEKLKELDLCNCDLDNDGMCHYCRIGTHCRQCNHSIVSSFIKQVEQEAIQTECERVRKMIEDINIRCAACDGAKCEHTLLCKGLKTLLTNLTTQ